MCLCRIAGVLSRVNSSSYPSHHHRGPLKSRLTQLCDSLGFLLIYISLFLPKEKPWVWKEELSVVVSYATSATMNCMYVDLFFKARLAITLAYEDFILFPSVFLHISLFLMKETIKSYRLLWKSTKFLSGVVVLGGALTKALKATLVQWVKHGPCGA